MPTKKTVARENRYDKRNGSGIEMIRIFFYKAMRAKGRESVKEIGSPAYQCA